MWESFCNRFTQIYIKVNGFVLDLQRDVRKNGFAKMYTEISVRIFLILIYTKIHARMILSTFNAVIYVRIILQTFYTNLRKRVYANYLHKFT